MASLRRICAYPLEPGFSTLTRARPLYEQAGVQTMRSARASKSVPESRVPQQFHFAGAVG